MLKFIYFIAGSLRPFVLPVSIRALALVLHTIPYLIVFVLVSKLLTTQDVSTSFLLGIGALLFIIMGCHYMALVYYLRQSFSIAYGIIERLRLRVCEHLRKLPLSFFKKNSPSSITGTLLQDMNDAEIFFGLCFYEIVACIVTPLILVLFMVGMDLGLTIVMLGFVLAAIPFVYLMYLAITSAAENHALLRSRVEGAIVEYIEGIGEIKGANRTGAAFTPYVRADARFCDLSLKGEMIIGIRGELFQTILELGFVVCLTVGSYRLANGTITLSVLLFFLLLGYRLVEPLQDLGSYLVRSAYYYKALKRVGKILYESPLPIKDATNEPEDAGFSFEHVNFAYNKNEKQVLHDISFYAPEGSVTALVGESGGGKTTIANLLLRFWDVGNGTISIGGKDIRMIPLEKLYEYFSVVFQDVYLFNDTILNNIRMSNPSATDEEVIKAAELACCHEFIASLKDGYNTIVGDNGARLSGGERQRVSIARAILKDAPILILDEATASVDPENELHIQQGINNLVQGKTLLVIAHRLNTIAQADQILVMRKGVIVEHGKHADLLASNGFYATLWKKQEQHKSWRIPKI